MLLLHHLLLLLLLLILLFHHLLLFLSISSLTGIQDLKDATQAAIKDGIQEAVPEEACHLAQASPEEEADVERFGGMTVNKPGEEIQVLVEAAFLSSDQATELLACSNCGLVCVKRETLDQHLEQCASQKPVQSTQVEYCRRAC